MNRQFALLGRTMAIFAALVLSAGPMSARAIEDHAGLIQFEGQWLTPEEARQREESRYRRQRVSVPFEISVELAVADMRTLRQQRDLQVGFMTILRVGDRVIFRQGQRGWLIWKRHARITPEFKAAIAALRKGESLEAQTFAADVVTKLQIEGAADPLSTIAFALHGHRSDHAHIDMTAKQLPPDRLRLERNAEDGQLAVLALGGQGVALSNAKPAQVGTLFVAMPAVANEALQLRWSQPPQRLLVIGDRKLSLPPLPENLVLQLNEKRVLRLSESSHVTAFERHTHGPDGKGWRRQEFAATLAGLSMDLGRDEVGPHQAPGEYRREWILRFQTQSGATTQRQTALRYRVTGEEKEAMSKEFLRR